MLGEEFTMNRTVYKSIPAKFSLHNMVHSSRCIKPPWISKLSTLRYEGVSQANQEQ